MRDLLAGAGYSGDGIARRLRATAEPMFSHRDLEIYRRRLAAEPDELSTLIGLLLVGDPVPTADCDRTLRDGAEGLVDAGLAAERDDALHGRARLVPHDELFIVSDRLEVGGADRVAGVHRPSTALAHLTVREEVERALDVGTGNGIQALLLSRHAGHVVATDVNERALAFAAFNLALNGADNVELRHGSLLEPVAGERFGCIACNPPYVISPDTDYTFRDSGLRGDRLSEELVRGLPGLLEPDGFATLMASWAQSGDDPAARPREWLDGAGCDAWILHSTTDDPLSNAAAWTQEAVETPTEFGAALDRWTAYYRELGIESVAYGALVLRRRDAGRAGAAAKRTPSGIFARPGSATADSGLAHENWSRGASLQPRPLEPASAHLLRMFAGVDAAAGGDDSLLGLRLSLAPTARFEQVVAPSEGWTVTSAALELQEGLGFRADVDEPTLKLLRALDGRATAREAIVAALGDEARPEAAAILRGMLETGFLVIVPRR